MFYFKFSKIVFVCRKYEDEETRDLIILFTDGSANKGITKAEALIFAYQEAFQKTGKKLSIPLSAMTVGDYKPKLLYEVSNLMIKKHAYKSIVVVVSIHFGSDANSTGAEGFSFYYHRIMYSPDQMLAMMVLV